MKMSDTKGPATRRRKTTTTSSSKQQQANGTKWHDAGAKPPHCPAKAKPAAEVSRQAGPNGKLDGEVGMSGGKQQPQLTVSPRKEKSETEDLHDRLR